MIQITDASLAQAAYEVDMAILDILPDEETCVHNFSPRFIKKMNKLLHKAKHYVAYTILRRVACFILVILLFAGTVIAVNPSVRAAIVNWVKEQFHEFYHYSPVESDSDLDVVPSSPAETEFVEDSTSALATSYSLGWVPDGYTLLDCLNTTTGQTCIYISNSGLMLQFTYVFSSETFSLFSGVGEYEQKYVNEDALFADLYFAVDPSNSNFIVWIHENDNVAFSVSGFLNEAELIKIAKNVITE